VIVLRNRITDRLTAKAIQVTVRVTAHLLGGQRRSKRGYVSRYCCHPDHIADEAESAPRAFRVLRKIVFHHRSPFGDRLQRVASIG
jgi:hypothetical protein